MQSTSPKSPALVTINSAESQESPETPSSTTDTSETKDSKKNSADIELLEGLCQNLWTLINERDWSSLRITPSAESSPSSSPPDLTRQISGGSITLSEHSHTSTIRDPESLATWIAPRFTVELNNREIASSFKDYMRIQRRVTDQYPQYNVAVQEISTELDMRHGWANVLVFTSVTGYPLGVDRQVVTMFKWKRSERQWWCTKLSTLRGGGRYDHWNATSVVCGALTYALVVTTLLGLRLGRLRGPQVALGRFRAEMPVLLFRQLLCSA